MSVYSSLMVLVILWLNGQFLKNDPPYPLIMAAIEVIPCGVRGSYSVCSVEEVKGGRGGWERGAGFHDEIDQDGNRLGRNEGN